MDNNSSQTLAPKRFHSASTFNDILSLRGQFFGNLLQSKDELLVYLPHDQLVNLELIQAEFQ